MVSFYLAQGVSVLTILTTILGLLQNNKSKILTYLTISNITIMITYLLLGRWLSIVLVGIATIRTSIYYYYSIKNIKPNIIILIVFELSFITASIILWQDYFDLFMIANLCLLTYTTWQDNLTFLRIGYLLSGILLITYDILVQAYVNTISDIILLIFALISIIKYDIKKTNKDNKTNTIINKNENENN